MYILHNHLPEFWADYCVLIYAYHWELMESVVMAAHHCYSWSDSLCATLTRLWLLVLSCWLHVVFVEISLESHSHVVFSSNLMNQKHMLQIISCFQSVSAAAFVLLAFSLSICWIFLYWVKVNVVPECESAKPHVDITANGL
jgi:hypothetical protein